MNPRRVLALPTPTKMMIGIMPHVSLQQYYPQSNSTFCSIWLLEALKPFDQEYLDL